LGAIVGTILGLLLDLVAHSQGFWFIFLMAGLIGGAVSLYAISPGEEEILEDAKTMPGHTFGLKPNDEDTVSTPEKDT
jgi:hypothetical protein